MADVKRKYEYIEGRKARENFEKAMTTAFQVPKEQVPRPEPKKRTAKPRQKSEVDGRG
jgi:hypothetical protein